MLRARLSPSAFASPGQSRGGSCVQRRLAVAAVGEAGEVTSGVPARDRTPASRVASRYCLMTVVLLRPTETSTMINPSTTRPMMIQVGFAYQVVVLVAVLVCTSGADCAPAEGCDPPPCGCDCCAAAGMDETACGSGASISTKRRIDATRWRGVEIGRAHVCTPVPLN